MDNDAYIKRLDEIEKTYAPEEMPPDSPEQARVRADEGAKATGSPTLHEPPDPAPVANVGSSPSSMAAPPNIGHEDHGGAPGDPQTEARDPMGT